MSFLGTANDVLRGMGSIASIGDTVNHTVEGLEKIISKRLQRLIRRIYISTIQLFFFLFAIVMMTVGITLYLTRYVTLDFVLIGMGIVLLLVSLIVGLMK